MNYANPSARDRDDVEFIASAAVARWEVIANCLTPVLGQRGVAALYRRALHVAGRNHVCLVNAFEIAEPISFEKLRKVLMEQPPSAAVAATDASIETFHELLNNLIGRALTQQLLGSAWSSLFSGSPTRKTQNE